jgi:hypothetical protein
MNTGKSMITGNFPIPLILVTLLNSLLFKGFFFFVQAQTGVCTLNGGSATLTGQTYAATLTDPSGISGTSITNIVGNGHNVHYDSSLAANQYPGGFFYSQVSGGVLTPGNISTIDQQRQTIPTGWVLYQNYPNPFNSETIIGYEIFQPTIVKLVVYNILGQQMKVLVEGMQEVGKYEILLNAAELVSGIYFYRLSAGGAVQTRKLILQK